MKHLIKNKHVKDNNLNMSPVTYVEGSVNTVGI